MEHLHDTREEWLGHAIVLVTPRIVAAGYSLPKGIKISCGYPIGARGGKKMLAQAISPAASSKGLHETFVSPVLDDPLIVLGAIVHELGHHAVGVEEGHGKAFKQYCSAIGLEGKATEALPGAALNQWLRDEVLPLLGKYPHAAVDPDARKKQGTRMIKLICQKTLDKKGNPYSVRMTQKWLDEFGPPTSPAGFKMVRVDEEESED